MSSAIEMRSKGRIVRFEPDGQDNWTVVQNGCSFEVSHHERRDEHGWTRHTYSLRRAELRGVEVAALADLATVARLICDAAY